MRENKRSLSRAIRELDRERAKLERQEAKVKNDIRKAAKENQMASVRIMAKDLIRTKNSIQKFHQMRAQLQAVDIRMTTMQSTHAMADAMKGAAQSMVRMNRQLKLPQLNAIMRNFAMESERMETTEEIMNDTIDDVMEGESDEEEEDELVASVLAEMGMSLEESVPSAPTGMPSAAAAPAAAVAAPAAVGVGASAGPGAGAGPGAAGPPSAGPGAAPGASGPALSDLQARLDNLRK